MSRRHQLWLWPLLLGTLAAGDWEQERADARGSGATGEAVPPAGASLNLLWSAQPASGLPLGSPLVVGARLYVGGEDGRMRCLDLSTGAELWSFNAGSAIPGSPAYRAGRLYFGTVGGTFVCLHAGTGATLWGLTHGAAQHGAPLVTTIPGPREAVLFGLGYPAGELRAYDALDGSFLWAVRAGQPIAAKPLFHAGGTPKIITANTTGMVQAFDAATGAPVWPAPFLAGGGQGGPISPALDGDRVVFCSGRLDRFVHVLDAHTGSEIKKMRAVPPGWAKTGGGPAGEVAIFDPQAFLSLEVIDELSSMQDKAERDEAAGAWAEARGGDAAQLKEWLDRRLDPAAPSLNQKSFKSGGPFFINLGRPGDTSSVTLSGGRAFVTGREISGGATDEFFSYALDVTDSTPGYPAPDSNLWGNAPAGESWGGAPPPAPALSADRWLYHAQTKVLRILDVTAWTDIGGVDVGDYITGIVPAQGRLIVTTAGGRLKAYAGANNPPSAPTAFSPAGGANVTTASPTLAWSGQSDAETAPASLTGFVEFAFGWANADLEIAVNKTKVSVPGGQSAYDFASLPVNTHVFWRVRVQDPMGAMSGWSPIQDFWVNRDSTAPEPPAALAAAPGDGSVTLTWSPSPSADVERYRLRYKDSSASWSAATVVEGATGGLTISGLTNGLTYDFSLTAVDYGENESAAVLAAAVPVAPISLGGSGSFATIQSALDAALPGQSVTLQPGTYTESITIRPGVSLVGAGASRTIIRGGGAAVVISVQGTFGVDPPSRLSGFTVTDGGTGIDAGSAEVSIDHVVVHDVTADAIVGSPGGKLHVENCTLTDNGGSGVAAGGLTSVAGSIIDRNGGAGVRGTASVTHTTLAANGSGESTGEPADYVDGAYHERDGSATVDRGDPNGAYDQEPAPNGARLNQGAYGNTDEAALSASEAATSPEASGSSTSSGSTGVCSSSSAPAHAGWAWALLAVAAAAVIRRRA